MEKLIETILYILAIAILLGFLLLVIAGLLSLINWITVLFGVLL